VLEMCLLPAADDSLNDVRTFRGNSDGSAKQQEPSLSARLPFRPLSQKFDQ
jgi:hypothetical protein